MMGRGTMQGIPWDEPATVYIREEHDGVGGQERPLGTGMKLRRAVVFASRRSEGIIHRLVIKMDDGSEEFAGATIGRLFERMALITSKASLRS
jgi:hypothetical protein